LSLTDYSVTREEQLEIGTDLVLEQVNLLLPLDTENPMILTRHPDLIPFEFLKIINVDGFLVDGTLLGIDADILSSYGPGVVVADGSAIQFEKGAMIVTPQPTATVVTAPPTPAPLPTATPVPPLPTAVPLPPTPTPPFNL
jgi:hypothetical protein